jgi:hypothetical protein
MTETVAASQWRVAWGPDRDGDECVVVFRMDDLARDSEGPQIVVTGTPMSSREEAGGEDDDDDDEESESFGNSTDFLFQVRNSAGDVIADLYMEDPDDYHAGWESESFHEASERAMLVVVEIADSITAKTARWRWDGSAEALRDGEEATQ